MNKVESTKDKIMSAAQTLFATGGIHGTSVRDIAAAADVNIAAVNYHFSNKQTLFWEVFRRSLMSLEEGIVKIKSGGSYSVEDLSVEIFHLMNREWMGVRNTFRMMLSSDLPEPDQEYSEFCAGRMGPPGGDAIGEALKESLGGNVPEKALHWGVKCIFSFLAHWSLIVNTEYVQRFGEDKPEFSDPKQMDAIIRNHAAAIVQYIDQHAANI